MTTARRYGIPIGLEQELRRRERKREREREKHEDPVLKRLRRGVRLGEVIDKQRKEDR